LRKFLENRFFFAVRVKMTAKHIRPADDLATEVAQISAAYCLVAANHRLVGANDRLVATNHRLVGANDKAIITLQLFLIVCGNIFASGAW
jgi:hypothetical protein